MFSSRGFGEESVETEEKKIIDQDWIHVDCETPVIALPYGVITGHLTVWVDSMLEAVQFPVEHIDHIINHFARVLKMLSYLNTLSMSIYHTPAIFRLLETIQTKLGAQNKMVSLFDSGNKRTSFP